MRCALQLPRFHLGVRTTHINRKSRAVEIFRIVHMKAANR